MASSKGYIRPASAEYYASMEKVQKGRIYKTLVVKNNSANFTGQDTYTSADYFGETIACSGYPVEIDDTVGVVVEDEIQGTVGVPRDFVIAYDMEAVLVPIKAADTAVVGGQLAFDAATGEFTTVLGGGNVCAVALEVKQTLAAGNSKKLPAGDWVLVSLHAKID